MDWFWPDGGHPIGNYGKNTSKARIVVVKKHFKPLLLLKSYVHLKGEKSCPNLESLQCCTPIMFIVTFRNELFWIVGRLQCAHQWTGRGQRHFLSQTRNVDRPGDQWHIYSSQPPRREPDYVPWGMLIFLWKQHLYFLSTFVFKRVYE